jgi:hypothetical protein
MVGIDAWSMTVPIPCHHARHDFGLEDVPITAYSVVRQRTIQFGCILNGLVGFDGVVGFDGGGFVALLRLNTP